MDLNGVDVDGELLVFRFVYYLWCLAAVDCTNSTARDSMSFALLLGLLA